MTTAAIKPWASAAALVALAATVPYLPVLHDYFIQDDFGVVALLSQKPASAFPGWFVSTWMDDIWGYTPDEIRPFPAVTYQIAAWWGAASPAANHVLNIAFHAANALLVLAVGVLAAGLSLPAATAAAVVFAVLPIHPETVAWVTGRVDSMPAFFYLAAFLAYVRWRQHGVRIAFSASVILYFIALFTKQNAVTFPAALVLYDALVGGRMMRVAWSWIRPYAPFIALTAGYLLLRYVLFGEVAREGQLNAQSLDAFVRVANAHLRRMVTGQLLPVRAVAAAVAAGFATVVLVSFASDVDRARLLRAGVFFGAVWIGLGIAPTIVAGYESPRHIYLASIGWAIIVGIAADVLWHAAPRRFWRPAASVIAVSIVLAYAIQLRAAVSDWNLRAAVSHQAVRDLEREALAAPEGVLIVVGAPVSSWEWALPFAARPPYTGQDLTQRVHILSPMRLHCCRSQWHEDARRTLDAWARRSPARGVIVLNWDAATGTLARISDREDPFVRSLMQALSETSGPQALEGGIDGALALAERAAEAAGQ